MIRPIFRFLRLHAIAVFSLLALATPAARAADTPEISTQLLKQEGMFSLRRQTGALVAEVRLPESDSNLSAFRILYAYISGDNTPEGRAIPPPEARKSALKGQKVPMMVPVTVGTDPAATVMRFYMPDGTPPLPWDPQVVLKRLPAETFAVITFSGLGMKNQMSTAEDSLRTWIGQQGATAGGPARYAYYNPPWTFPWDRKNEVWIPLRGMPTR